MSNPVFTASIGGREKYLGPLNGYMHTKVLNKCNTFICDYEENCSKGCVDDGRKLYRGQLHHVGQFYDLKRNDKPFRIVISGAEYGDESENVSIECRTCGIHSCGKCIPPYPNGKLNAHMRGTLFLLQLLFGKDPMNPSAGEKAVSVDINGDCVNIFKAFSMANFLLCSARNDSGKQEIQRGAYTPIMQEMCKEHYKKAMEILKPQIIILQGTRSYDFWHDKPYSKELNWDPAKESQSDSYDFWREHRGKDLNFKPLKIEKVKLANCEKETLILPLCHPSQLPFWSPRNWGSAGRWAIRGYIKPAVENLLKEYEKIYG